MYAILQCLYWDGNDWCWKYDSVVKSTHCPCRRPGLDSQPPTLVTLNFFLPPWATGIQVVHRCTFRQNTHAHTIILKNFLRIQIFVLVYFLSIISSKLILTEKVLSPWDWEVSQMVGCICSLWFHPQHVVEYLWSLWFGPQHLVCRSIIPVLGRWN